MFPINYHVMFVATFGDIKLSLLKWANYLDVQNDTKGPYHQHRFFLGGGSRVARCPVFDRTVRFFGNLSGQKYVAKPDNWLSGFWPTLKTARNLDS